MFLYSPQNCNMKSIITIASEKDFPEIVRLAQSFDLDCENIAWNQFIVAKKNESIIGFGRLRAYSDCSEVATVGVIKPERNKGIGTSIVKELIRMGFGSKEIYVTCVIPNFFLRLGFETVKQYPALLQKKVDFCKLYDFTDEQIFVMKFVK